MTRTILICLGILFVAHYLALGIGQDAPRSWYLALTLIVAFQIERIVSTIKGKDSDLT